MSEVPLKSAGKPEAGALSLRLWWLVIPLECELRGREREKEREREREGEGWVEGGRGGAHHQCLGEEREAQEQGRV